MQNLLVLIFILFLSSTINAQQYLIFDDSPTDQYYGFSWGYSEMETTLERQHQSKFPVSSNHVLSGKNALRLSYNSHTENDWMMALFNHGWNTWAFSDYDSLVFYVYTKEFLAQNELPRLQIEDQQNRKSTPFLFPVNLEPQKWNRIALSVDQLKEVSQHLNHDLIKSLFFISPVQPAKAELFIDKVMLVKTINTSVQIAVDTPTNLRVTGYPSHFDLAWQINSKTDVSQYRVYRKNGSDWDLIGSSGKDHLFFVDWIGDTGISHTYSISSVSLSGTESPKSSEVSSTTSAFTHDDQWLEMVQKTTFRYFWDYGHPVSGLTRERLGSGHTVTSGGSGFGLMTIPVAIERGWITKNEAYLRVVRVLNFLETTADRFHGVWPHWLNGESGKTIPFSQFDDGGDLVETAFLAQGLLTLRAYFSADNSTEQLIRETITRLWESIEWDWYRRTESSDYLYWHWSPNYGWQMNFPLSGWNETMIVYLLAIASPTHGVPATMYHSGWAGGNRFVNGKYFYQMKLPVGWDWGGPLFFTHYSYLGFDPRLARDQYTRQNSFAKDATYYDNNKVISLIHHRYAISNPGNHLGYGDSTWGLTASDNPFGYSAHEPVNNDNGTITPTAGLSAFPYTPNESMGLLKNLYHSYGDRLWGIYGFKDAFNLDENWFAQSYLAIDQGPIVVMIENHRTRLLWNLFMSNPEIKPMMQAIGFDEISTGVSDRPEDAKPELLRINKLYPNPFNPDIKIEITNPASGDVSVFVYNMLGQKVSELFSGNLTKGNHQFTWVPNGNPSGMYIFEVVALSQSDRQVGVMIK